MHPNNRLVWIGLGAALFLVTRSICHRLHLVQELTVVTKDEIEGREVGQETEEALMLDTLFCLSRSANFDLRSAALRMICERATRSPCRNILLGDLRSSDALRRHNAISALEFLIKNGCLQFPRSAVKIQFRDRSTFAAIVACLCQLSADRQNATAEVILQQQNLQVERRVLEILAALLAGNIPAALSAGLVGKWLSKYPFRSSGTQGIHGQDVPALDKLWRELDPAMGTIIVLLLRHPHSRKSLRKYGLIGSSVMEERDAEVDESGDVRMTDGEETAGSPRNPQASRRRGEETAEEQALRRRRREAMVLSDGGHPISSDNIIERLDPS